MPLVFDETIAWRRPQRLDLREERLLHVELFSTTASMIQSTVGELLQTVLKLAVVMQRAGVLREERIRLQVRRPSSGRRARRRA